MSESDLDDALKDMDLSGLEEGGGDEPAADEGGGDDVQLDSDLEAALAESGEGDAPAAEDVGGVGEDSDFGDDLEAALASVDVDDAGAVAGADGDSDMDDLGSLADALGGGGEAPAAGGAPAGGLVGLAGLDQDDPNVEFLLDIKLHVTFEVGRAKMLISDLLTLGQGSVVELHRLVGDELDLFVNGKLLARGEVVVVNEKFGCRVSSVVPPEDRIKFLAGT